MAKPYQRSGVYRSRTHDPLKHRLVDMAIGFSIGAVAGLILWGATLLVWVHG